MPPLMVALALGALGAVAATLLWTCMPFGAGLSPDSAVYLAMADGAWTPRGFSLPYGRGLFESVRDFPPLYPAVLGSGKFIGYSAGLFSRMLCSILFGLNTLLVGWTVYRSSRGRVGAAIAVSILFVLSVPLLSIHAMVWSEPLFLSLLIIGMLGLSEYLVAERRTWLLVGCSAIGCAAITRYAGVASVAATLYLLGRHAKNALQWRDTVLGSVCATLPIVVCLSRNYRLASELTGRDFQFHIDPFYRELGHALVTILSWFSARADLLPDWPRALGGTAIFLFIALASCRSLRPPPGPREFEFVRVAATFSVCYVGLLVVALIFFDPNIPLDYRILCPLQITLMLVMGLSLPRFASVTPFLRCAAVLSVGGFVVLNSSALHAWFEAAHRDGQGYASGVWRNSKLWPLLSTLPSSTLIYATAPNPLYIYIRRSGIELPLEPSARAGQGALVYKHEIAAIRQRVLAGDAAIVYFNSQVDPGFPAREELTLQFGPPLFVTTDGLVWAAHFRAAH